MTKQKIITTTPNQQIIWSMVYLNTIPIRNLSHRNKNGNRENRQPVEPKSVKQQSQQNKTGKILWREIVLGGAIVLGEQLFGGYCPAPMVHLYDIVTRLSIPKIEFQFGFRPFAFHIAFDLESFVTKFYRYKCISVCT
jgi:hypothetical protein